MGEETMELAESRTDLAARERTLVAPMGQMAQDWPQVEGVEPGEWAALIGVGRQAHKAARMATMQPGTELTKGRDVERGDVLGKLGWLPAIRPESTRR